MSRGVKCQSTAENLFASFIDQNFNVASYFVRFELIYPVGVERFQIRAVIKLAGVLKIYSAGKPRLRD